ncbi:MAG TPA: hypothetical protein VH141_06885 [Pseudonocardia sp.]|jgi:hypothetical protein|nr:hypothetical protein [Pseudonocardia sp.]
MSQASRPAPSPARIVITAVAWLWVLVPFLYGVWQLLIKVVPLFSG